jgi:hypothetical protein
MKIFQYHKVNGFLWFRFFGKGLCIKNTKKWPKLFSERNGYTKHIMIGNWLIKSVNTNG